MQNVHLYILHRPFRYAGCALWSGLHSVLSVFSLRIVHIDFAHSFFSCHTVDIIAAYSRTKINERGWQDVNGSHMEAASSPTQML